MAKSTSKCEMEANQNSHATGKTQQKLQITHGDIQEHQWRSLTINQSRRKDNPRRKYKQTEKEQVIKRDAILSAATSGKLNRLKELVAKYDDGRGLANTVISIKDDNGVGVIHFAATEGKLNVLKYLIEELGLDVDIKDDAKGESPLFHAVVDGNINTVDYLLGKGANPNTSNTNGSTPLHYAAQKGYTEILTRLLSRGINVNGSCEDGTLTPLEVAGATLSPLEMAAANGQLEAIQILLDHNADPNLMSCRSYTPLAVSIVSGLPQSLRCLELLLEAGADPDGGSNGVTPLVVATHKGLTEIIRRLVQAGANPDVTFIIFNFTISAQLSESIMVPNIYDFYLNVDLAVLNVKGHHHDVEILFPVTSRIPGYIDWSIGGVMTRVQSDQAKEQWKLKANEKFQEAKEKGAEAFKEQDYYKALYWYSQASDIAPYDANVLSNRSMCWARVKDGKSALENANKCILLRPDWPKAYYRAGVAYNLLKRYSCAQEAFLEVLKLSPNNQELKDAYREAVEAQLKSA
ncbi:ankyrin-3-like [Papaver somniferum]|uniref:ankyrin-3-like n=1 Tax=Papaver somniferum TaxID=3469 RepID=UPI000E7000FC|nr:ankyrin-3-like [Papaver somniferum]